MNKNKNTNEESNVLEELTEILKKMFPEPPKKDTNNKK